MKKKMWLIIAPICMLLILVVGIIFVNRSTPQDKVMEMLNRVEKGLGDAWDKQNVTEVFNFVYSNNKGNSIVYHVCLTTYYKTGNTKQTGLNTDAISAVISPDEAENCRECTVNNFPATIYLKDGRAYLCWTIEPKLSCVIEYDPAVESEEDMLRMRKVFLQIEPKQASLNA